MRFPGKVGCFSAVFPFSLHLTSQESSWYFGHNVNRFDDRKHCLERLEEHCQSLNVCVLAGSLGSSNQQRSESKQSSHISESPLNIALKYCFTHLCITALGITARVMLASFFLGGSRLFIVIPDLCMFNMLENAENSIKALSSSGNVGFIARSPSDMTLSPIVPTVKLPSMWATMPACTALVCCSAFPRAKKNCVVLACQEVRCLILQNVRKRLSSSIFKRLRYCVKSFWAFVRRAWALLDCAPLAPRSETLSSAYYSGSMVLARDMISAWT